MPEQLNNSEPTQAEVSTLLLQKRQKLEMDEHLLSITRSEVERLDAYIQQPAPLLNEHERHVASRLGVSPEEYARQREQMRAGRG